MKKRYRELARKIAGIWYQKATDDYHLERAWRDKLDIAGLNPDLVGTLGSELIRDAEKLQRAIQGAVDAKAQRKERMRQKKLAQAIEIRQAQPSVRETMAQSLERMTNQNVFRPQLKELVRNEYGELERNPLPSQHLFARRYSPEPEEFDNGTGAQPEGTAENQKRKGRRLSQYSDGTLTL